MQPHQLSPHVVFAGTPPWRDSAYPPAPGGQHFLGTALAELLAEPSVKSPHWLASVYGRLVVASSGPMLVGGDGEGAARLERARWLRVAPDADMAAARQAAWPALARVRQLGLGVGSLAPDLVVVAERDPYDRLPMFARSGVWLFRALRHLGFDELTVYVTNALNRDQRSQGNQLTQLRDAFAAYEPQWLALGAIPHEVLANAGIDHVAADHPSHARRFDFAAGVEGYAAKMLASGLHRGPCERLHAVGGGPDLALRLGIPASHETKATVSRKRPSVAATVVDQAHTKFVLGEVKTVKEAAALVTDSKTERAGILKLAREQGWEVERDRYLAQKREQTKSSASAAEAARISRARSLAWEIHERMLEKLNEQMRKGETTVYAKDAKAIGELAMDLSKQGDLGAEDERARLAKLEPEAFGAELRRKLADFGLAPEDPPAKEA